MFNYPDDMNFDYLDGGNDFIKCNECSNSFLVDYSINSDSYRCHHCLHYSGEMSTTKFNELVLELA
jgi:hypothetical protein